MEDWIHRNKGMAVFLHRALNFMILTDFSLGKKYCKVLDKICLWHFIKHNFSYVPIIGWIWVPLTLSGSIMQVLPATKSFFFPLLVPTLTCWKQADIAEDCVDSLWYSSSYNRDSQGNIPTDNGIILELSGNLKLWGVRCGLITHSVVWIKVTSIYSVSKLLK